MFRKVEALILILFCFNITAYCQGTDRYQKASVIFFKEANNISRIKVNKDTTEAFFRIIHIGMETEEKRNEVIKKYRNKRLPPPAFYTTFVSVSQPERICSIARTKYITVKQLRKNTYLLPSVVYIIQKIDKNRYLKWKAISWAEE